MNDIKLTLVHQRCDQCARRLDDQCDPAAGLCSVCHRIAEGEDVEETAVAYEVAIIEEVMPRRGRCDGCVV